MYRHKSTEGKEALKTEVAVDAPEKKSYKPPNWSNTNFSLHFKGNSRKATP